MSDTATALLAPERWLAAVPADSDMTHPERHHLFSRDVGGVRMVFATNGHILIAEANHDREAVPHTDPNNVLGMAGVSVGEFSGADLLAWSGPAEYPVMGDCPSCKGRGEVEHDCDCEYCTRDSEECVRCRGDEVATEPEVRRGAISGFLFNRNYVAMVVEAIGPDRQFTASLCEIYTSDGRCLRLDAGGGLFGLVMGLRANDALHPGPELLP